MNKRQIDPRSLAFVACVGCGDPLNLTIVRTSVPACGRCRAEAAARQSETGARTSACPSRKLRRRLPPTFRCTG